MRYAILFKAFFIDEFVLRRLAHVVAAAPGGDVYLMIDETNATAGPIAFDRVIRFRESDVVNLGFAPISTGSLFWYNADYPLYYFQGMRPEYDYIVMIEYDAVPNCDLDSLVDRCRAQGADFVGKPIDKSLDDYWWTGTMLHFYKEAEVRPYLICAAVLSAAAVRHLAQCRLEQARDFNEPDASRWPIGECFVGTELARHGFSLVDLAAFGNLKRYDWWPPTHEAELPDFTDQLFVHPVLIGRKYVQSLFKSTFVSGLIVTVKYTIPGIMRLLRRKAISVARPWAT